MEEPKQGKGRGRLARFAKMVSVRLTPNQVRWLEILMERYELEAADVMRRGLTEMARREGLDGGEAKGN